MPKKHKRLTWYQKNVIVTHSIDCECQYCGKHFVGREGVKDKKRVTEPTKFCSAECARAFVIKGGLNKQIVDEKLKLHQAIRHLDEYSKWRMAVMTRDGFRDVVTQSVGGSLDVHHIVSFVDIIESNHISSLDDAINCKELWDIDNGITLSKESHKQLHAMIRESR